MDLTDLKSVKAFAEAVKKEWERVDIMALNGGIMAISERTLTKDGFETQVGLTKKTRLDTDGRYPTYLSSARHSISSEQTT